MSLGNRGWDITAPYGFMGETIVADLLALPADRRIEVKRKSFPDSLFYIEVECQYHYGWSPSGIVTTEAETWIFQVADTGVSVVVPTARLRAAVERAQTKGVSLRPGAPDGDHPTRGYLLSFYCFVEEP